MRKVISVRTKIRAVEAVIRFETHGPEELLDISMISPCEAAGRYANNKSFQEGLLPSLRRLAATSDSPRCNLGYMTILEIKAW